jgi:biopolymer transport protein ExbD
MSKASKKVQEELKMDMTPMIDCVFLLIIFFVLVIDLSQKDLEDLILPKAEYAVPDDKPPDNRPILNIMQDGRVMYKGNEHYNPITHGENFASLIGLLVMFKNTLAKDTEQMTIGTRTVTLVNDPILIRADKWTEWHWVGKVMEQCAKPEAAFWKLELAMSEEDKELKIRR